MEWKELEREPGVLSVSGATASVCGDNYRSRFLITRCLDWEQYGDALGRQFLVSLRHYILCLSGIREEALGNNEQQRLYGRDEWVNGTL